MLLKSSTFALSDAELSMFNFLSVSELYNV